MISYRLLYHASDLGVIPVEHLGGIKGVSYIDMGVCKHLF